MIGQWRWFYIFGSSCVSATSIADFQFLLSSDSSFIRSKISKIWSEGMGNVEIGNRGWGMDWGIFKMGKIARSAIVIWLLKNFEMYSYHYPPFVKEWSDWRLFYIFASSSVSASFIIFKNNSPLGSQKNEAFEYQNVSLFPFLSSKFK